MPRGCKQQLQEPGAVIHLGKAHETKRLVTKRQCWCRFSHNIRTACWMREKRWLQ